MTEPLDVERVIRETRDRVWAEDRAVLDRLCKALSPEALNDDDALCNRRTWQTGLHCGLEDQDIVDRYEACDHGFDAGVERAIEYVKAVLGDACITDQDIADTMPPKPEDASND